MEKVGMDENGVLSPTLTSPPWRSKKRWGRAARFITAGFKSTFSVIVSPEWMGEWAEKWSKTQ
jgi:hypothetical protein